MSKKKNKKTNTIKILKTISIIMLIIALGNNPYGYYQILRWVVCGTLAYSAYLYYQNEKFKWTWIFGVIAILYNPISSIHLARDLWGVINVVTVILIVISILKLDKNK